MRRLLTRIAMVCSVGVAGALALADGLDLAWHTIDGGGLTQSAGGDFELSGTIGQPDAGVMTGGGFELTGGFWFETPPGDCNFDGMTNQAEFDRFRVCLAGPVSAPGGDCDCFDLDGDGDVDLIDFGSFQDSFNGR